MPKNRNFKAQLQEIQDRIKYRYQGVDGNYNFPDSYEGDVLKMVHELSAKLPDHNKQIAVNTITNIKFPVMLRKMWSGREVQNYLDDFSEQVKKQ